MTEVRCTSKEEERRVVEGKMVIGSSMQVISVGVDWFGVPASFGPYATLYGDSVSWRYRSPNQRLSNTALIWASALSSAQCSTY